jgi:hypothetical protein
MRDRFDLKGITPESWACIDCGINTAPGSPSRVELERRYRTSVAIEKLSGKAPELATLTFDERCEVYTVREAVWKAAGMEPMGGCLCVGCLEQRLGRSSEAKRLSASSSIQRHAGDRAAD